MFMPTNSTGCGGMRVAELARRQAQGTREDEGMGDKAKGRESTTITPWQPFMEFERWERDTARMMEDLLDRRMRPWWPERRLRTEEFELTGPAIDIYEEDDDIVVKAELPGITTDSIEVNLAHRILTIKGVKKREVEIRQENYFRSERSYGSFRRAIELPKKVRGDKVKASFKNGILEVRLPKTEDAKLKEVKVKID
jgi:HSP20 family protein